MLFFVVHTATVDALINEYKSTVWNPHIPAMHYLGMNVHLENEQRPACLVKPANKRFYGYLGVLYTKCDVRILWGSLTAYIKKNRVRFVCEMDTPF